MSQTEYERAVQQVNDTYRAFIGALKTALDRKAGII